MNYQLNSASNQESLKYIANIGLAIVLSQTANANDYEIDYFNTSHIANSSQITLDYSPDTKCSSQTVSFFQNDEVFKEYEKSLIIQQIKQQFDVDILGDWVPDDVSQEKTCLFIKINLQFQSFEEFDEFEARLYSELKETLNGSKHFDMIALI